MTVHDTRVKPFVPRLTFADRLRLARRYAERTTPDGYRITGMTQQDLADALSDLHPSKPPILKGVIGNYESGQNEPRHLTAFCRAVEKVTGVDAAWLAGFPKEPDGDDTMFRCTLRTTSPLRVCAGQRPHQPPYPRTSPEAPA